MIVQNRVLFRFTFLLVVLWIFPFPLTVLRSLGITSDFPPDIYKYFVPSLFEWIFDLEDALATQPNGSGDRSYNYFVILFQFILSFIGTMIWSFFSKKERDYTKLNYWFLVLVRFFLGFTMIYYGLAKVIQSQFPQAKMAQLLQPFGEHSPMGLAWAFFGFSQGYNIFIGLGELIGGILLFHRKTSILGALILLPVISNIVAVNFFYDIPVKIFSSQLLLLTIIILLPHAASLWKVILANHSKAFLPDKFRLTKNILKAIFVLFILYFIIQKFIETKERRSAKPAIQNLHQQYKVNSSEINYVIKNDSTSTPSSSENWKYMILDRPNYMIIAFEDGKMLWHTFKSDSVNQAITINGELDPTKNYAKTDYEKEYTLNYTYTDSTVTISGVLKNNSITVTADTISKNNFLLNSTGFRWINEYPFNR